MIFVRVLNECFLCVRGRNEILNLYDIGFIVWLYVKLCIFIEVYGWDVVFGFFVLGYIWLSFVVCWGCLCIRFELCMVSICIKVW